MYSYVVRIHRRAQGSFSEAVYNARVLFRDRLLVRPNVMGNENAKSEIVDLLHSQMFQCAVLWEIHNQKSEIKTLKLVLKSCLSKERITEIEKWRGPSGDGDCSTVWNAIRGNKASDHADPCFL